MELYDSPIHSEVFGERSFEESNTEHDLFETNPSFWDSCETTEEGGREEFQNEPQVDDEEESCVKNVSYFNEEAEDIYNNLFHHTDMSVNFEHLINPTHAESSSDNNDYSRPIHDHTPVSCQEALLVLMAIKLRHKLSNLALEDIISFCNLLLPSKNSFVKDAVAFNQFFQQLKHPITKHFYCPNKKCQMYVGSSFPPQSEGTACSQCGFKLSAKFFFIEIPLENQLQTLLSSEFLIEGLTYI